jgi:hypothetical protein
MVDKSITLYSTSVQYLQCALRGGAVVRGAGYYLQERGAVEEQIKGGGIMLAFASPFSYCT